MPASSRDVQITDCAGCLCDRSFSRTRRAPSLARPSVRDDEQDVLSQGLANGRTRGDRLLDARGGLHLETAIGGR
jgi:hypothetical protein